MKQINIPTITAIVRSTIFAAFSLLLFAQCSTTKTAAVIPMETRLTDTVFVTDEQPTEEEALPPYRSSFDRSADLLHTDLNLSFNYAEKAVNGRATLTFTPQFYPIDEITLDAKTFDILETSMNGRPIEHNYDGSRLTIVLDKGYKRGEKFDVFIQYIAHPYKEEAGGSAAIMSDRGLYFVDADESNEHKPTQIWTQGETESNSKWFPTIDKPNERCTQKIRIRVKDEFETLSNGILTNSKDHEDGTRTDTWEMNKPHAPYLFMLAIGDFHRQQDVCGDLPLEYLVEHDYADDAEKIFNHTPEMITFFSEVLNYQYPWDKYSQVIVRDYVSGAMENTSASLFGQFLQHPAGDLIDNGNDKIVAHELFHQWFGDLVTCESWSNLTLNEGFANYSEYLWLSHKYGREEGDNHRFNELQGYLGQAQYAAHPLINFHYNSREDMFDAHSYNKGGLVLHMLRELVGEEAFFASLNHYLNEKAFEAAEVHDLRLAFEHVTGLDLNWFFNQWFLQPGHPVIDMDYSYSLESNTLTVQINQVQKDRDWPIFYIPTTIEIYTASGKKLTYEIVLEHEENTFSFNLMEAPELIILDPNKTQLMQYANGPKPSMALYNHASSVWDRMQAISLLQDKDYANRELLASKAIQDPFWVVRQRVIQAGSDLDVIKSKLNKLVVDDPHTNVRVAALRALDVVNPSLIEKALGDKSNRVKAVAAMRLLEHDANAAKTWADQNEQTTSQALLQAVAEIYVDQNVDGKTEFFKRSADRMSFDMSFPFFTTWAGYLVNETPGIIIPQLETWTTQLSSDDTDVYKKYAILTGLQPLAQQLPMDSYETEDKTKIQNLIQQMGMVAARMFGQG